MVLAGLKTSYYSRKTGHVVINLHDQFTSFEGPVQGRSTARFPLCLLVGWIPSWPCWTALPFLFNFIYGSAGYTNGINLLSNGFPCFISAKLHCKMPSLASTFCVIIVNSLFLFFFPTVSGILLWIHVFTDSEKFRPSLLSQYLKTTDIPCALHLIFRQTCLSCGNPLWWTIFS